MTDAALDDARQNHKTPPRSREIVFALALGVAAVAYFAAALLDPTVLPFFGLLTPDSPGFDSVWTFLYSGWVLVVGILGSVLIFGSIEVVLDYYTQYDYTSAFRHLTEQEERS